MSRDVTTLLFALLRSALKGDALQDTEKACFSVDLLPELYALSQAHDVAHLVGFALQKNGLWEKDHSICREFHRQKIGAIYRREQMEKELQTMAVVLEEHKIPFLPLKGAVLSSYYPEPWMRTSCDIDILVPRENLESAVALLTEKCGYEKQGTEMYDVSLMSTNRVHVELHFDLMEKGYANRAWDVLHEIWSMVTPKQELRYWHEMPDSVLYFYHVAHMAKHLVTGGCGIRPFLDLWVLSGLPTRDEEGRKELLQRGNLLQFSTVAEKLSRVWIENLPADDLMARLQTYLLEGGAYGSFTNRITVSRQKKGGAGKYALSRLFVPYERLKVSYPILEKHPELTPLMQFVRWGKALLGGHGKRVAKELQFSRSISREQVEDTAKFLQDLGL